MSVLLEPFAYGYMLDAMWVSALTASVCAFLSVFLMLKGWSLIGDALSHAIVPGVAGAFILGFPFALGAFIAGGLAAAAMLFIQERVGLKQDAIIGLVFTGFFGVGLFMVSLSPASVDVRAIAFGDVLAIEPADILQIVAIGGIALAILSLKWRDLMAVFFDEAHARSIGLPVGKLKFLFFALLSCSAVAALQTVGAFLVIAMLATPGATAHLLADRFSSAIRIAVAIGVLSGFLGAYSSYFLDGATGGVIALTQTLAFALAFAFSPRHGIIAARKKAGIARREQLERKASAS